MKNVYIYWAGSEVPAKIEKWRNKFKKINFIVGPSNDDHEYLMRNIKYYRESFDLGIWAFCSDVWRCYILRNKKGLYTDVSVELGDNFPDFVDRYYDEGPKTFIEKKNLLASAVFFGPIGDKPIEIYKNFNKHPRLHQLSMHVLTTTFPIDVYKHGSYLEIHNENEIVKNGSGSWYKGGNPEKSRKNFESLAEEWRNGNPRSVRDYKIYDIDIWGIRYLYDYSRSKKELKMLRKEYKAMLKTQSIYFKERLVWSKLFRFFTGKWLKTKNV